MRALVRPLLAGLLGVAAVAASGDAAPASRPQAPAPTPAATPAPDIEDFVPTEKVGADDAVSFPTDI